MEGGKKSQSGSSFTSDLFGSKNSASGSSSGIFGSLFSPPDKISGREANRSFEFGEKNDAANQDRSYKTGDYAPRNEEQSQSRQSKDMSSYYQDEKPKPFNYGSSIYYGGQDIYTPPESKNGNSVTNFKKDEAEDDQGMASRGNWWQGSLYY